MFIPPSKSQTQRALFCAALARGKSVIQNPLLCEDTQATINVLKALGIHIEFQKNCWNVYGDTFSKPSAKLFCNESGTTYRFITALTKILGIECEISGKPSLLKRPIDPLMQALKELGNHCEIDGSISSQFLSALLLAAPLAKKETTIEVITPLVSKFYVVLTLEVQKRFGIQVETDTNFCQFKIKPQTYQPTTVEVEGDWSSAAFLIALGLLKKEIRIEGLNPKSLQPDRKIFEIVREMKGEIFWEEKALVVKPSSLNGIHCDVTDTPDLYPILSVLSAFAKKPCTFSGIERLKFKESDRVSETQKVLQKTGLVESKDHRIVMAAAVLGSATNEKISFQHPECVAKSYPKFWEDFKGYHHV